MRKIAIFFLLPLTLIISACADNIGANHYNTSSANTVNRSATGRIISVRMVTVSDGSDGQFGKTAGAVAGGAAGSMIGGNTAVNVIGAVGGAVIGGIAGDAAQNQLSKQTGFEYVVQLDGGGVVTVVQGADIMMQTGQRVIVLYGRQARVIPYNG